MGPRLVFCTKLVMRTALEILKGFSFLMAVIRSLTPHLSVAPTFEPLIEAFLDWIRVERGFSPETILTYGRSIRRFLSEADATTPERISSADVLRVKRMLMN